jgi:hypothetical protein
LIFLSKTTHDVTKNQSFIYEELDLSQNTKKRIQVIRNLYKDRFKKMQIFV